MYECKEFALICHSHGVTEDMFLNGGEKRYLLELLIPTNHTT